MPDSIRYDKEEAFKEEVLMSNEQLLIKEKVKSKIVDDITLASKQSLAKDWMLPEEDVAWANL